MIECENKILNRQYDVSHDFFKQENHYFLASKIISYNAKTSTGILELKRNTRKVRLCFDQMTMPFEETSPWEFPPEYDADIKVPFSVCFVSARTIRIKMAARGEIEERDSSLMLVKEPEKDDTWSCAEKEGMISYSGLYGTITIIFDPFTIEIRDKSGNLLTRANNVVDTKNLENCEPMPFSILRRSSDMKRRIAASFSLSANEKIFGGGESFTKLDKRGQKLILYATDALSVQTNEMYKPIPFFMSSKGYGMFHHTSAPLTFDFGSAYDGANTAFLGDDQMDLFIFLGKPKEILAEYTNLTGRSPVPPLWSFGLWMSRISYFSEEETREVAQKLREYEIPCDVIHLDTGWFEKDWRCDYQFSKNRFYDPVKMIADLKEMGFRISLWQLPYFAPTNPLYREAVEKGFVVKDADGGLPTEDAIIDFSNKVAVNWYQGFLRKLLKVGVGAIKVDFGEAAPFYGSYSSGKSGFYEHNLYPLRYNKAVYDITKDVNINPVIWARSAWAGSQRYPIHWGGDAENTDCGMACTLRAGLSLGLCGFSFWSHDIGGFVKETPEELYRRWMPFGMLTSHSRCHGAPPKEPWYFSKEFIKDFRKAVELKYRLMPYVYTQACICSRNGYPMMRTLFFEYPDDPGAWGIEDEYLFGSDILVAPLLEEGSEGRQVYLPEGGWFDYQTDKYYEGGKWHFIKARNIPCIILAANGSAISHADLSQTTKDIEWNHFKFYIYAKGQKEVKTRICINGTDDIHELTFSIKDGKGMMLDNSLDIKYKVNIMQ